MDGGGSDGGAAAGRGAGAASGSGAGNARLISVAGISSSVDSDHYLLPSSNHSHFVIENAEEDRMTARNLMERTTARRTRPDEDDDDDDFDRENFVNYRDSEGDDNYRRPRTTTWKKSHDDDDDDDDNIRSISTLPSEPPIDSTASLAHATSMSTSASNHSSSDGRSDDGVSLSPSQHEHRINAPYLPLSPPTTPNAAPKDVHKKEKRTREKEEEEEEEEVESILSGTTLDLSLPTPHSDVVSADRYLNS